MILLQCETCLEILSNVHGSFHEYTITHKCAWWIDWLIYTSEKNTVRKLLIKKQINTTTSLYLLIICIRDVEICAWRFEIAHYQKIQIRATNNHKQSRLHFETHDHFSNGTFLTMIYLFFWYKTLWNICPRWFHQHPSSECGSS